MISDLIKKELYKDISLIRIDDKVFLKEPSFLTIFHLQKPECFYDTVSVYELLPSNVCRKIYEYTIQIHTDVITGKQLGGYTLTLFGNEPISLLGLNSLLELVNSREIYTDLADGKLDFRGFQDVSKLLKSKSHSIQKICPITKRIMKLTFQTSLIQTFDHLL
jgi:hypothetical protein